MATEVGIPVFSMFGTPVAMPGIQQAADAVWIDPDLPPEPVRCSELAKGGHPCGAYVIDNGVGMCVGHHRSWLAKQQRGE